MGLMESITVGKTPKPRRIMLYGIHGVGKSQFGAMTPEPIFVPTEDGLGEIDCAKFPLARSLEEVFAALEELAAREHPFQTAVLDSLDWLERLIWEKVCQDKHVKNIEDIGYGKGYVHALNYWRKLLELLDTLRDDRGMMVVLIAHSQIERFQDPAGDSYDRYAPRLHKLASAVIQEWADEVLFANYSVVTRQADEGFGRTRNVAIGGDRLLHTTGKPSHVAKNRLALPEVLPLCWADFRDAMAASLAESPQEVIA